MARVISKHNNHCALRVGIVHPMSVGEGISHVLSSLYRCALLRLRCKVPVQIGTRKYVARPCMSCSPLRPLRNELRISDWIRMDSNLGYNNMNGAKFTDDGKQTHMSQLDLSKRSIFVRNWHTFHGV